jgi:hypothetical protein
MRRIHSGSAEPDAPPNHRPAALSLTRLLASSLLCLAWQGLPADGTMRLEHFDQEPANWEGVNNRGKHFSPRTVTQWRTPNSLVVRVNARGEGAHYHVEYCTSQWQAGAGVIGEIVPGQRIDARMVPSDKPHLWTLEYDPQAAEGRGVLTLTLDGVTARCEFEREHRADGATFTHFGLLPVLKSWELEPGDQTRGARFDRFGICTPWLDGNSVTAYVHDLAYTCAQDPAAAPR